MLPRPLLMGLNGGRQGGEEPAPRDLPEERRAAWSLGSSSFIRAMPTAISRRLFCEVVHAAHEREDRGLVRHAVGARSTQRCPGPAQYASEQITTYAAENGITRSMGYTGICWDNAMAESFFATLKTEFYYRRVWPTRAGAHQAVGAWIEERYNRRRRHSSIGQISPVAFEMQHCNQTAAAPQPA